MVEYRCTNCNTIKKTRTSRFKGVMMCKICRRNNGKFS
jgi:hypothetical protein